MNYAPTAGHRARARAPHPVARKALITLDLSTVAFLLRAGEARTQHPLKPRVPEPGITALRYLVLPRAASRKSALPRLLLTV